MRLALAALFLLFSSVGAHAAEAITQFTAHAQVMRDQTVTVTERISVTAEGRQIKRGIYRNIPTSFAGPDGETITVRIEVLSVRRDGGDEPYVTSRGSGNLHLRIGDADVFLDHGSHTYDITYRARRALIDQGDQLVFRWYASGWDWDLVRQSIRASVGFDGDGMTILEAFEGDPHNTHALPVRQAGPHAVQIESTRPHGNGSDIGIAVSFPASAFIAPEGGQALRQWIEDNLYTAAWIAIFAASALILFILWLWIGRDPARRAIIPRFRPPEDLSPAAVRMIWQRRYDPGVMTAAFASLIAKNRMTMDYVDGSFLEGDTLTVRDTNDKSQPLASGESILFAEMLADRDFYVLPNRGSDKSKLSKFNSMRVDFESHLDQKFSERYFSRNRAAFFVVAIGSLVAAVIAYIYAVSMGALEPAVTDAPMGIIMVPVIAVPFYLIARITDIVRDWRERHVPFRIKEHLDLIGVVLFAAFFMGPAPIWPFTGDWGPLPWIIAAHMTMLVLFRALIEAPTAEGSRAMEEILGLRQYLKVAEEHRLKAMGAPEQTPEHLRETYAYAVALDVEEEWSKKLDTLIARIPDFADRSAGLASIQRARLSGTMLGAALGSSVSTASSASTPKSSSSGGFSSGGGFSGGGGGFGGGGGGGW